MKLATRRPGLVFRAVMLALGALTAAAALAVPGSFIGKTVTPSQASSIGQTITPVHAGSISPS